MALVTEELQHLDETFYTDDITEEPINEFLSPIDLYFNEPLVSLEEAIAPIIDLFPNLKQNIDFVKDQCIKTVDNLTQDEIAVLYLYRMRDDLRCVLNRLLRSVERQNLFPFFNYLNLLMTALLKLPSVQGVIWRTNYGEDLREKYPVKYQFIWWGLSTCRTTSDFLNDEKRKHKIITTLFLIESTSGKTMNNCFPTNTTVDEVILLSGSHFEVIGHMNPTEDLHIIHLKQLTFSLFNLFKSNIETITSVKLEDVKLKPTTKIRGLIDKYREKTNWWLRKQQLTDNDIKELADFLKTDETCRTLELSYNDLSAIAAYHIADMLTTNHILKQLYLSDNLIDDNGAQVIFEVLKYKNKTLEDLALINNEMTNKSVESILEMINLNRTITYLHFGGNGISSENQKRLENNTVTSKLRIDFIH